MPAAQRSRQRAPQIPSYLDPEPTEHFSFRVTLVLFKVWPRRRQSEDHTATLQWSRRTKVTLTALHLRQVPLATHRRLKSAARNKQCKAEKHLHVDLSPVQAQQKAQKLHVQGRLDCFHISCGRVCIHCNCNSVGSCLS